MQANVFGRPRIVSVLKTQYFDICFPKKSADTAAFLAEHCDQLYERACFELAAEQKFRMPVVISPDSDVFSVEYSASPYNRIVIYGGLPDADSASSRSILLDSFFMEAARAVASSIRSPFWQVVSRIFGADSLQPAALLNMPYSFVEGAVQTASSGRDGSPRFLNDAAAMQLLSQARADNAFPRWIDAAGSRDTYPGKRLAAAAGAAFASYLQQRWGMEAYLSFWKESGKVHFFKLTAGIFKKVYGLPIAEVWKDFENSIPLYECEDAGTALFPNDAESRFRFVNAGKNGIVWYDESLHEVAQGTFQPDGSVRRRRLFTATDITSLSLSPDGTKLAVSYRAEKMNRALFADRTKIYDIERRAFFNGAYSLRCAALMELPGGAAAVVGVKNNGGRAQLAVHRLEKNSAALCTFDLPGGMIPESIAAAGTGAFLCALRYGSQNFLATMRVAAADAGSSAAAPGGTLAEQAAPMEISAASVSEIPVRIADCKFCLLPDSGAEGGAQPAVCFTFIPLEPGRPSAAGYAALGAEGIPARLFLQDSCWNGGVAEGALYGRTLYFSARHTKSFQLRAMPFQQDEFREEAALPISAELLAGRPAAEPEGSADGAEQPELEGATPPPAESAEQNGSAADSSAPSSVRRARYNPLPYMFRGTWLPMIPISSLSFDGYQLAPGLGLTYITQMDPLENVTGALSFCTGFADPAAHYQKIQDNFNLSAYVNTSFFPVDIFAGASWMFEKNGEYTLQVLCGAKWNAPLGMTCHRLSFAAQQLWQCTTAYTDNESGVTTELDGWPSVQDAFNTLSYSLGGSYSSYRRCGISSYEQLGWEAGLSLVAVYDFEKMDAPDFQTAVSNPTQLTITANIGFKIPHLIPVSGVGDWVICLPLTVYSSWNETNGTTSDSFAEVLLAGYEIQRGIPGVNLYFQRCGIKFGYDLRLQYDEQVLPPFDLRNFGEFWNTLASSEIDDYLYFSLEAEFSPVVGKAAANAFATCGVQFQFHLHEQRTKVAAIVKLNL
ncbi:MAG: hypothetical protein K2H09_07125 [Treponemataceae bacterium]|nr:hypothetical protein [Treponemataceae bacterium]